MSENQTGKFMLLINKFALAVERGEYEVSYPLHDQIVKEYDQQAARIAALETALRGFLHHFTGDTISTCPLCLYGIESEYHLSDCPVEIARQALGEAE